MSVGARVKKFNLASKDYRRTQKYNFPVLDREHYFWAKLVQKIKIVSLRIPRRLSKILKTSNKSIWSNVFRYVKVYIFWKFIRYNIHGDKTQMLKKFCSEKINDTKNTFLFFLPWAPSHHIFSFNSHFIRAEAHGSSL